MEERSEFFGSIRRAIEEHAMLESVNGVLIGYSGGADSTALLLQLKSICESRGIYVAALHVHHGIRGLQADRDAEFCRHQCEKMGVDYFEEHYDIPAIAKEMGKGLEETARICRYEAFAEKVKSISQLDCIATAHNADDNAETVIYNIARGCGFGGLTGIPPVRTEKRIKLIRPLIYCTKDEILDYLKDIGAGFVFDSTNDDNAYTRNYIRHEIMPHMRKLNPSFVKTVGRMTSTLLFDKHYFDNETERYLEANLKNNKISAVTLAHTEPAIASRAIIRMIGNVTNATPEGVHIEAVRALVKTGRDGMSLSLCGGIRAVIADGMLCFTAAAEEAVPEFMLCVPDGVSHFDDHGFAVISAKNSGLMAHLQKNNESLQNIYKLSIYTRVNFDKISGRLFVRSRRDGDSYVFGGMTRKLKKLYNDRKYSKSVREQLPIFCDGEGIIWVPGFPPADRVRSVSEEDGGLVYYTNIGDIV